MLSLVEEQPAKPIAAWDIISIAGREYYVSINAEEFEIAYLQCRINDWQLITFSGVSELNTLRTNIDPGTWWTGVFKDKVMTGKWCFLSTGQIISGTTLETELIKLTTPISSLSLDRQCSTLSKTEWITAECNHKYRYICERPTPIEDPDSDRYCHLDLPFRYSVCSEYVVCNGKNTVRLIS